MSLNGPKKQNRRARSEGTEPLSVTLPKSEVGSVKALAKMRNLSQSAIVSEFVRRGLDDESLCNSVRDVVAESLRDLPQCFAEMSTSSDEMHFDRLFGLLEVVQENANGTREAVLSVRENELTEMRAMLRDLDTFTKSGLLENLNQELRAAFVNLANAIQETGTSGSGGQQHSSNTGNAELIELMKSYLGPFKNAQVNLLNMMQQRDNRLTAIVEQQHQTLTAVRGSLAEMERVMKHPAADLPDAQENAISVRL